MHKSAKTVNSITLGITNENGSDSDDGSIFSSSSLLSSFVNQTTIRNYMIANSSSSSNSQTNEKSFKKKVELSVTSLSRSIINLFDRIKEALCNLVNIKCDFYNINQF